MTRMHHRLLPCGYGSGHDIILPVMQKYTEALTLCPGWSGTSCCTAHHTCHICLLLCCGRAVLLVNRALCQKKKEAWTLVQQDAEAALAIDSHLLKVGYFTCCIICTQTS